MRVAQRGQAIFDLHLGPAHQSAHGLRKKQVSPQLGGQPVSPVDLSPARGGEMVERLFFGPEAAVAPLHVGNGHQRVDLAELFAELGLGIEPAVEDVGLKI